MKDSMKTEIYTSYFANYKNIPQEYQCISVANTKPDSLFIPEWALVRPAWNLVQHLKSKTIAFNDFAYYYSRQLETKPASYYIEALRHYSTGRPVVLMCWEKDYNECHRKILSYWLQMNALANYKGEL